MSAKHLVLLAAASCPSTLQAGSGERIQLLAEAGEGKTPRFEMVAYTGGLMYPKGFEIPVVVDLQGLEIPSQTVPALRDHDVKRIVGQTTAISVKGDRIVASGVITGTSDDAKEALATGKGNFPWEASIGCDLPDDVDEIPPGERVTVNGRLFEGPIFVARQARLKEISFVVFGADRKTRVTVRAVQSRRTRSMLFKDWLKAKGIDQKSLTASGKKTLLASWRSERQLLASAEGDQEDPKKKDLDAEEDEDDKDLAAEEDDEETVEAEGDADAEEEGREVKAQKKSVKGSAAKPKSVKAMAGDPVKRHRQLLAAETTRTDRIGEICAQYGDPKFKVNGKEISLKAHAIEQGWDADKTELEAMRESRPQAPAGYGRNVSPTAQLQAMEGAVMLAAGTAIDTQLRSRGDIQPPAWMALDVNDPNRQRVMEAAHKMSDLSMIDWCREACRADGKAGLYSKKDVIEAAFSGGTIPKIFTASINARVMQMFQETADSTQGWCAETEHADFKLNDVIGLKIGAQGMRKLPRGGTAQHGVYEDKGEGYRVHRYAEQYEIDEQDIIDDRFELLSLIPNDIANQALRLRPDLVYAILLSNPNMADGTALFHSSRSNVATSAALAEATLKTALASFQTRRENGATLNLQPTHLVTAAALQFTADALIASAETRGASGGPTKNVLQNRVGKPIADGRIDNGVVDPDSGTTVAGSASAWFVFCQLYPAIEVAYLRGTGRAPRVRRYVLDRGKYGIGWDVSMDVGAKAIRSTAYKASA